MEFSYVTYYTMMIFSSFHIHCKIAAKILKSSKISTSWENFYLSVANELNRPTWIYYIAHVLRHDPSYMFTSQMSRDNHFNYTSGLRCELSRESNRACACLKTRSEQYVYKAIASRQLFHLHSWLAMRAVSRLQPSYCHKLSWDRDRAIVTSYLDTATRCLETALIKVAKWFRDKNQPSRDTIFKNCFETTTTCLEIQSQKKCKAAPKENALRHWRSWCSASIFCW